MRMKLRDVPVGHPFMILGQPRIYEHRGNGWYSSWLTIEDGGPWHMDQDSYVDNEPNHCVDAYHPYPHSPLI